jgi:hypothetical protein
MSISIEWYYARGKWYVLINSLVIWEDGLCWPDSSVVD